MVFYFGKLAGQTEKWQAQANEHGSQLGAAVQLGHGLLTMCQN